MKWNKFRLKTTTEAEDIISSMLMDLGIQGVEIEDKIPLKMCIRDRVLGAKMPMSADTQKETFQMIIEDTLGEDGDYETVRSIHENLHELIEEHKEEPEPLSLDKTDVKKIFEKSGVPSDKMEEFEKNYEENAGEKTSLLAANIAETRKFNIETPDIVIKVNPERADLIETRVIDGRQCLVIAVDDHIEVNGIHVRTIKKERESADTEVASEV